jgi:hypothetical protein
MANTGVVLVIAIFSGISLLAYVAGFFLLAAAGGAIMSHVTGTTYSP